MRPLLELVYGKIWPVGKRNKVRHCTNFEADLWPETFFWPKLDGCTKYFWFGYFHGSFRKNVCIGMHWNTREFVVLIVYGSLVNEDDQGLLKFSNQQTVLPPCKALNSTKHSLKRCQFTGSSQNQQTIATHYSLLPQTSSYCLSTMQSIPIFDYVLTVYSTQCLLQNCTSTESDPSWCSVFDYQYHYPIVQGNDAYSSFVVLCISAFNLMHCSLFSIRTVMPWRILVTEKKYNNNNNNLKFILRPLHTKWSKAQNTY